VPVRAGARGQVCPCCGRFRMEGGRLLLPELP
jgi:hypothetical protein